MKKKIFTLLALFACVLSASADNKVTVTSNVIASGGTIYVELENTDEIGGFQVTLNLPDGLSYVKATTGSRLVQGKAEEGAHYCAFTNSGQSITAACFGGVKDGKMTTLIGNSGALFAIEVSVTDASKLTGGSFSGELTTSAGSAVPVPNTSFDVVIADRYVIDENSTITPMLADGVNVTVKRSIKKDVWNTIVLPFNLTQTKAKAVFGDNLKVVEFDGFTTAYSDEEDVTPDAIKINFKTFSWTKTGMVAGTPYLIKTDKDDFDEFNIDAVKITVSEVSAVSKSDNEGTKGVFTGSLVKTSIPEDALFISDNKFWYSKGVTNTKGLRGWFELGAVLGKATDFGAPVFIVIDGETTKVEEVRGIFEDGAFYNLNGMKVENPTKKGVYIQNGKKIVVK